MCLAASMGYNKILIEGDSQLDINALNGLSAYITYYKMFVVVSNIFLKYKFNMFTEKAIKWQTIYQSLGILLL